VDRKVPVEIYASTNNTDPETGNGSDVLKGILTPDDGEAVEFSVSVQDDNSKMGAGQSITSVNGGEVQAYTVYATISDEEHEKLVAGGSITAAPGSSIYFWVK
jgi:hypothetical protein